VEGGFKALTAAVVVLLLALGLAACGNGDSTASEGSEDFVPQQHNDSGGGAQQFHTKDVTTILDFGVEAKKSEFDQAAADLHNFLDARVQGAWSAACSYMDQALAASVKEFGANATAIKGKNCAEVLEYLTKQESMPDLRAEAAQADAGSLRVEGVIGYLVYRSTDDLVEVMSMVREGGDWKVDSLNAIPLTMN